MMPTGLQPIDRRLKVRDVAVDIEVPWLRNTVSLIEPAPVVRIRVSQAGLAGKQRIAVDEAALDDRKQVADRLEALDCSEPTAGADGSTWFDIENHFDEFTKHAGRKLGEADPPEAALLCHCLDGWHACVIRSRGWQEPEV